MSDLIIEGLNHAENAHNTVKVFLTRMVAVAVQREFQFARIFYVHGNKIAAGFKELCANNVSPSIKVSYMEVALAITKHKSGISWILDTAVWKEIFKLCQYRSTVFIVRQTYKFMSEFLWAVNDVDDQGNLRLVLDALVQPLIQMDFLNRKPMTSEDEIDLCNAIEPSIQIFLSVVSKEQRIVNTSALISILIKEYKLVQHLILAIDWIRSEKVLLVMKLSFWLMIGKTFLQKPKLPGTIYSPDDFLEAIAMNFNMIQAFIQRRNAIQLLEYCAAVTIIWSRICDKESRIQVEEIKKQVCMKNQMLFLCLIPILAFVTYQKSQSHLQNTRISDYISRLLNSSCEHTTKAAYALRDLTLQLDTLPISIQSVKTIIYLKDHMDQEQGNLVFQALFYVLLDFDPIDMYGDVKPEEDFEESEGKIMVVTYVLDAILLLITECNVNWHESLEIICLYNIVSNILRKPNLTCKVIILFFIFKN